ncbi:hypothetical protein DYG63_15110 [Yersinia enterocolitica]|nr:hypothetical protein [Yersinia enterocolitica]
MSLIRGSPCGLAQAPFKIVYNQFVIRWLPCCNTNYFGYRIISWFTNTATGVESATGHCGYRDTH